MCDKIFYFLIFKYDIKQICVVNIFIYLIIIIKY